CGSGNNGLHLIALQLHDASRAPTELYRLRQNIPNIPTPVAAGDLLVLWHDRGVFTCVDPASGAVHWRERIGGNFHSSPLRIGDRIYGISLTGEVVVLAAESEFKIVARHELGEGVVATPAVADGRLIIRTEGSLLCLESAP
ncbi:MAG TPA: PQQ-binding-like beta-propeller repeat protein, partial [Lacipirellulaceae bacterium]|nr:PQQ-binding-like beta-propeller repeat protein [Lacipirellulaceae bacterium]